MEFIRQRLEEIAKSQDYEGLETFRDPSVWSRLSVDDRELLALLFVLQGEQQLQQNKERSDQSFLIASEIAPGSGRIFLRQGLAYMSQIERLSEACRAFETAAVLQPDCFSAWFHWGVALVRVGAYHGESEPLKEADAKFQKAVQLAQTIEEKNVLAWRWGLCWFAMGKLSGEAYDFHFAREKLREAELQGFQEPHFYNDYGYITQELGLLLHRMELLQQALDYFRKAVEGKQNLLEAWLGLGALSQRLYQITGYHSYFVESDRAFRRVVAIAPDSFELWLGWAQLYLGYGKMQSDVEPLRLALEKYEKAGALEPKNLTVISGWAEALILVGAYTERLELIREGLQKSEECVHRAPENGRVWFLNAQGLTELGRYFGEEERVIQAIEKLKHGLTLQPNDPLLWHGLGQATFLLGELRHDDELIERAAKCCEQVVALGGDGVSQLYNEWGVALMRLHDLKQDRKYLHEAIDKFEKAIAIQMKRAEVDGHRREGVNPEWLYNYGCALDFLGDQTDDVSSIEKAIHVLTQVIVLDASFSYARYNLALAFFHLGSLVHDVDCLHKSLELFQVAVEHDPEEEAAWMDWGVALITLAQLVRDPSRPDHAASLLEHAETKLLHAAALGSTQAYYPLACLYSLLGNYPGSLDYLERAEEYGALPSLEELSRDEWLEGVRQTDQFRHLMQQLTSKNRELPS